ncbi:MAG: hypothetical protein JRN44_00080 [Nitrososphaerota archaeon]|nr:hypothetical protein [Nitrososphaerota archaeon]MDG6941924.1 hypothetical protein [Nitrososphaerota archaeon]MDG6946903.1 hypothetical protein [Nitrososphaerota archaeon]
MAATAAGEVWEEVDAKMRVVRLTPPLQALVPVLALPALSKGTRGMTLIPGSGGAALGAILVAASSGMAYALYTAAGPLAGLLPVWLVGTAGAVLLASAMKPTAFVKPICVRCRLLPVIREHEAIHLSGVGGEEAVWESMRSRHSIESLSLEGDPAICAFCPIPKRLAER